MNNFVKRTISGVGFVAIMLAAFLTNPRSEEQEQPRPYEEETHNGKGVAYAARG